MSDLRTIRVHRSSRLGTSELHERSAQSVRASLTAAKDQKSVSNMRATRPHRSSRRALRKVCEQCSHHLRASLIAGHGVESQTEGTRGKREI
jgi:hypothetical protein